MIPTHDSDRTNRSEIIVNHLEQLNDYDVNLQENIKVLNKVIAEKETEIVVVWWWFSRPSWLRASQKSEPEEPQDPEPSADQ